MSEYDSRAGFGTHSHGRESSADAADSSFDLSVFAKDSLRMLLRLFWLPLLLAVVFGALLCYNAKRSYRPMYKASATFTVNVVGMSGASASYYSKSTAEQFARTFPYILTSGVLRNLICEDLIYPPATALIVLAFIGKHFHHDRAIYISVMIFTWAAAIFDFMKTLPASINAYVEGTTTLFTLETTAADPELAYKVLVSAIDKYPQVANYVVGNTELTLISPPAVPSAPYNSLSYASCIKKGAALGILLGIAVAVIAAATRKTVRSTAELKSILNLRCIGTLPYERVNRRLRNKDSVSLRDDDVTKNFGDSIKLIRSRIQKSAEEHGDKVILFASSVPGEGKTTVALNTAVALAQEGKCTVLIDCDVRKPATIGDFRGLKPAGLVEYLNGTAELADIISQPVDNLFVINGNTTADNAAELFRTDKMAELINALREVAELIILDSPPCAILADAQVLAGYSDCAVYVVCREYTRKSSLVNGIGNLSHTGIRFIGYVLNNAQSSASGLNYGRYSRYGRYSDRYGRYGRYGKYGKYGRYGKSK